MDIKAIETEYNGYRFRSRLEARWAVFFDAAKIKYEYEPEGFELADGTRYLPDFYLPELFTYVEIKPADFCEFECQGDDFYIKAEEFEKYATACNAFVKAGYMYLLLCGNPMDVLLWKERSDERLKPICGNGRGVLFEALQCYVKAAKQIGAKVNWNAVECKDRKKCKICNYSRTVAIPFNGFLGSDCFAIIGSAVFTGGLFPKHIEQFKIIPDKADADAYIELGNNLKYAKKARQARFEHGEKP